MQRFKKGLISVSFRKNTAEDIVKAAAENGLKYIEWGSDVHARYDDFKAIENIAKLQEKYAVKCSSYGTYFRIGENDDSELLCYISAAKMLGTNVLRVWCGNKKAAEYTESKKQDFLAECKKIADIAEKNNVLICAETHHHTYTETKEGALELMRKIESPSFKMYWQPNQYRSEDENIEYIKLLNPYITHIHVFNWKGEKRFKLIEALDEWRTYLSCIEGEHILFLEFMPNDRIDELKQETMALNTILEGF